MRGKRKNLTFKLISYEKRSKNENNSAKRRARIVCSCGLGRIRIWRRQFNALRGTVVDVLSDEQGAETGAGIAGGGAMVSGGGNSSTIESSKAVLDGDTIYGILIGGSYAKDGATASVSGDSSAEMLSGNVNYKSDISSYDPSILGGGFAHSLGDLDATSTVLGASNVTISGGYSVYAAAGGAAQSDGSGRSYSEILGKSTLSMSGG